MNRRAFLTAATALAAGFVFDAAVDEYVPLPAPRRFWDFGRLRPKKAPELVAFDIETMRLNYRHLAAPMYEVDMTYKNQADLTWALDLMRRRGITCDPQYLPKVAQLPTLPLCPRRTVCRIT